MRARERWSDHPVRIELRALYAEADELVRSFSCACAIEPSREAATCCHFAVTGREPYPTPVELCEVAHARRASGSRSLSPERRSLPLADDRGSCPLLSAAGRCLIYASRPFGCRTYFCPGHEPPRETRAALQAIGRRIGDLAARWFPRDPLPRPFTRALLGATPAIPGRNR